MFDWLLNKLLEIVIWQYLDKNQVDLIGSFSSLLTDWCFAFPSLSEAFQVNIRFKTTKL